MFNQTVDDEFVESLKLPPDINYCLVDVFQCLLSYGGVLFCFRAERAVDYI